MDNCKLAICFGILVGITVFLFINKLAFLDKNIYEGDTKYSNISLWKVTHFITYFIIGILCPNNYILFLILGICWEIFEKLYGEYTNNVKYWTSDGLYSQIKDVGFNMLGYHIAHFF